MFRSTFGFVPAFGSTTATALLAIVLPPVGWRVPVTVAAVVLALAGTGLVSARLGRADARRATLRVVGGGLLAMAVTYAIGTALGAGVG